ncbi:MAG: MgtC/SapB family protein [Candidatus Micrarchaeota archaeon]
MAYEFLSQAILSLAIGGLIGLERGKHNQELGLRSFALTSFIGFLSASVIQENWLQLIAFIGISGTALAYYYFKTKKATRAGITTTIMLPLTFVFGLMVAKGLLVEAGFACIATVYLLVEKKELHHIVDTVSKQEITDLLIFAIITFIIYPLLPEEPYLLLGQQISVKFAWAIVVAITAISFVAHVLLKYFGRKAIAYAALIGGVISSQATLAVFSEKMKDARITSFVLAIASVGAITADAILVLLIAPNAFITLTPILISFIIAALVASIFSYKYVKKIQRTLTKHKHPLSLRFIAEFATLLIIVNLVITWTATNSPELVSITSFIGGLLGATAVIASLLYSNQAGQITNQMLATDVFLALIGSLAARTGIALLTLKKNRAYIWKTAGIMLAITLIGAYVNAYILHIA